MRVFVAALSARSIVQAAHAAGFDCIAADCFGDTDTKLLSQEWFDIGDHHHGSPAINFERLFEIVASTDCDRLVLGAGIEADLSALSRLSRCINLAGTPVQHWYRCRDPIALSALAREAGLRTPATRVGAQARQVLAQGERRGQNWLVKSVAGCGAGHIRPAKAEIVLSHDEYLQECVAGDPVSATCLVDDDDATVLGLNLQQYLSLPTGRWRFDGIVSGFQLATPIDARIRAAIADLVRSAGIRGLCSVDLMVDTDLCHVLEINPRPGASFELYDGPGLIKAHITGCASGAFVDADSVAGLRTVYSAGKFRWPAATDHPDWITDKPAQGEAIAAGWPVCTVHARGDSRQAVEDQLGERVQGVLTMCEMEAARGCI